MGIVVNPAKGGMRFIGPFGLIGGLALTNKGKK